MDKSTEMYRGQVFKASVQTGHEPFTQENNSNKGNQQPNSSMQSTSPNKSTWSDHPKHAKLAMFPWNRWQCQWALIPGPFSGSTRGGILSASVLKRNRIPRKKEAT